MCKNSNSKGNVTAKGLKLSLHQHMFSDIHYFSCSQRTRVGVSLSVGLKSIIKDQRWDELYCHCCCFIIHTLISLHNQFSIMTYKQAQTFLYVKAWTSEIKCGSYHCGVSLVLGCFFFFARTSKRFIFFHSSKVWLRGAGNILTTNCPFLHVIQNRPLLNQAHMLHCSKSWLFINHKPPQPLMFKEPWHTRAFYYKKKKK